MTCCATYLRDWRNRSGGLLVLTAAYIWLGLAQIGNNAASLNTLSDFRNGVSASTAQSADRILDRFLNRMPTITIREGTRVKIILTDDLALPAYQPKEL